MAEQFEGILGSGGYRMGECPNLIVLSSVHGRDRIKNRRALFRGCPLNPLLVINKELPSHRNDRRDNQKNC